MIAVNVEFLFACSGDPLVDADGELFQFSTEGRTIYEVCSKEKQRERRDRET